MYYISIYTYIYTHIYIYIHTHSLYSLYLSKIIAISVSPAPVGHAFGCHYAWSSSGRGAAKKPTWVFHTMDPWPVVMF